MKIFSANKATNKTGLFKQLVTGLTRTRKQFTSGLAKIFLGKKVIDQQLLEQLEEQLLLADIGVQATQQILQQLTDKVTHKQLQDPQILLEELKQLLISLLQPIEKLNIIAKPQIILVVGINGSGKTTTIGKLAYQLTQKKHKVILAAGDTFRPAAIEQLQTWGERSNVPVIAQQLGSDSASVIYDAIQSAIAKNYDVLIADTAGRLHTKHNLMDELAKIKRVITKINPQAPQEILLVLDASIGQNALQQAIQFNKILPITGLVITKLDGTAKGGIVFAIAKQLEIPIKLIGVGEQADDLRPFDPEDFVNALFNIED